MTLTRIALIVAFVLSLAKPAGAVDLEVSELVGAIKRGIAEAQKSASPLRMHHSRSKGPASSQGRSSELIGLLGRCS